MKPKAVAVPMSRNGRPGRADRVEPGHETCTGQDISTPTPIYTLSTPVLVHSPLPNSIMPAHRHLSTARSHAAGEPYKASIIVISSDEEEEPLSVPKRGSRKPRRSRAEGEILEILDETSVKVEEPDLESLRRRCQELEQACSPHCSMNPPYKRDSSRHNLLGARYFEK
jgi:hypothetical protein